MKFTRVRINGFYNLKDVDLDFSNGSALIVGPNGSGKTNIIKCIDFLIKQILGLRDPSDRQIWDVNDPECCIEVNATLSRAEVEMFSNLRVCYLVYDVCLVVSLVVTTLQQGAILQNFVPEQSLEDYSEKIDLIRQRKLFCDLPEETFKKIFLLGSIADCFNGRVTVRSSEGYTQLNLGNPCVSFFIDKTIEKLFPKLLEITKEALASRKADPEHDSVMMRLQTGLGGGLDYSRRM